MKRRYVSFLLAMAVAMWSISALPLKAEENGQVAGEEQVLNKSEDAQLFEVDDDADVGDISQTPEQVLSPENPDELETITGMDENGNVYEVESGEGKATNSVSPNVRAATGKIVNFNTKGNKTTSYTEVGTGKSGYTCGSYGADAAYLGTSGTKVKFMLSGVIGEVQASEVQVLSISQVQSHSYYVVSNGRLLHKVTTDVTKAAYPTSLDNGPAPSYLVSGTSYYSYDGHYFYTYNNFSNMLSDYNQGIRTHSVNPNTPYFNYFQYLPLRSKTSYSGSKLNQMINNKTQSDSKMRNMGTTIVNRQNTYGVNALLITGVAANESAWGRSSIAKAKNNLFGLNAVDSSPGESANYYPSVDACIREFAETYMSKRYLRSGYTYYSGGFLGNKASGINVSYASDPYWGEKAANVAWSLDKGNGSKDYGKYTIGIKDLLSHKHTGLNVRKESSTSSPVLYKTPVQSQYSFLILDHAVTSNGFYRVQSDPVLKSGRTGIDTSTGVYQFNSMYAYVSKDYVTVVQKGNSSGETESNQVIWETVEPVKVPNQVANVLEATPHVSKFGWIEPAKNGQQVGTTGISYPMEAIKLKVNHINGLGIEYSAYVKGSGWQSYVKDGAVAGTTGKSAAMQGIKIRLTGNSKEEYAIYYRAHVSNVGWMDYVSSDQIAGIAESEKKIEAIQVVLLKKEKDINVDNKNIISYSKYNDVIGWGGAAAQNGQQSGLVAMASPLQSIKIKSNLSGLGVEYTTHISGVGWQSYVADGAESKVLNKSQTIEAVKIRLSGNKEDQYDIFYRVHSAVYGWLGWAKNGQPAGTKGYSCQAEALQIIVVKKGTQAPGSTTDAYLEKRANVTYSAYVNGDGWKGTVRDGALGGTAGQSKALGGLKINIENKLYKGSVQYKGHVQDKGWDSAWIEEGKITGTADGKKRLEAVKMRLTDEMAEEYNIYYRTHVQNFGWLGWAKNGTESGSEGYGYRVEAIEIRLVKKGEAAPGSTEGYFKQKPATVQYSTHVQNIGWQLAVKDGATAGTSGKSLRIEAMKIQLSGQKYTGNIQYSAHVQNVGWQPFVSNGSISGTMGKTLRVEAIKIQLTGELSKQCDIYYRVHAQDFGWLAWTKNGAQAGSRGYGKRLEALEIKIVEKGDAAPNTAGKAFYSK